MYIAETTSVINVSSSQGAFIGIHYIKYVIMHTYLIKISYSAYPEKVTGENKIAK